MIVASDLDGTLSASDLWKGLAAYMRAHGRSLRVNSFIAANMPRVWLYRMGLLDGQTFGNKWIRDMLGFFAGMTTEEFGSVAEWIVEHHTWPNRRPEIESELRQYLENGDRVILATGTFLPIVERFAKRLGISEFIATELEVVGGRLTGGYVGQQNNGRRKAETLAAYLDGERLDVAYGDTAPDESMLEMSANAVAVYPDKDLALLAEQRGWRVIGERK